MSTFLRRPRNERGLALPLALLVLTVTGVMLVGVIQFSSASGRTANVAKAGISAEALAEAGLANAFAVLNYWDDATQANNASDPTLLGCDAAGTSCTPIVSTYPTGTASWHGVLNETTKVWAITSIGSVANSSGNGPLTKQLTARVSVTWNNTQPANVAAWNYVYSTKAPGGGCEMTLNGNNIVVDVPVYVKGDLCFSSNNSVIDERGEGQSPAPQPIDVRVGGKVVFAANNTSIGVNGDNVTSAAVAGGCTTDINIAGTNCNAAPWKNVRYFADTTTIFQTVTEPTADFASFYASASPGPNHDCVSASNPSNLLPTVFDSDTTRNGTTPAFELTPGSSYQCKTYANDATSGTQIGELSWNHTTQILTVRGVIFIDGNVNAGTASATYQGSGTLYVGGKFTFTGNNTQLCANAGCNFATWNPNTEMLLIIANGATGDQDSMLFNGNAGRFQGGIFCNPDARVNFNGNTTEIMGPVICGSFSFQNSVIMKPLPAITQLPIGAPTNPNVHAMPSTPSYGG